MKKSLPITFRFGTCAIALAFLALGLAMTGCKTTPEEEQRKVLNRVANKLDRIDRLAEQWGRGTISDIALIDSGANEGSNGFFALQYSQPMSNYVALAQQNTQGFVSESKLVQSSSAFALQFTPGSSLPTISSATNIISLASNAVATTSNITAAASNSVPNATNVVSAATNSITTVTNTVSAATNSVSTVSNAAPATNAPLTVTNPPFTQTLTASSQSNSAPQLSANVVLKIAATDKETERILNYMSDPISLPNNKKAYLGVMQVSILPGWRTKMGYIGEVQVSFQYAMSKARCTKLINGSSGKIAVNPDDLLDPVSSRTSMASKLGLPVNTSPTIISAFPFAEAQILDLSSSYQRQLSFLAQLAGSVPQVPGLQAALSTAFNKLTQQNLATRSALPLVVPSSQGADVTYRFDPELQALVNPASPNSGAGQVLEPSSFPALIVIICDADDLVTWDELGASVETRWIPTSNRHWFKKIFFDPWYYDSPREETFSNGDRLNSAFEFDKMISNFSNLVNNLGMSRSSYTYQEATRRLDNLKTAALGHTLYSKLAPVRPLVTSVYPPQFRRDYLPRQIRIQGRYFESQLDKLEFVGLNGMNLARVVDTDASSQLITAQFAPEQIAQLVPGQYDLEVVTTLGKTIRSNAVTVLPTPAPVISSVIAKPIKEYPPGEDRVLLQRVHILGQNFIVGDDSLKVSLGSLVFPQSLLVVANDSITLDLDPTRMNLKPGGYDLIVATSGGQSTAANAVQVDYKTSVDDDATLPPTLPRITGIYPDVIRYDLLTAGARVTLVGDFFNTSRLGIMHVALGAIPVNLAAAIPLDSHSLSILLPPHLAATNYDLEVVNQAGRVVISNALQIIPVTAPSIDSIIPMPLQLTRKAKPAPSLDGKSKTDETVTSPSTEIPPSAVSQPDIQPLAILGKDLQVEDESFQLLIGGMPVRGSETVVKTNYETKDVIVSNQTVKATVASYSTNTEVFDCFTTNLHDNHLLMLNISTNLMRVLKKDGKYDVTIITSGGRTVLSNAIVISTAPPSNQFAISTIYPTQGLFYSTSTFGLIATNINTNGGWSKSAHTQVSKVLVGGRDCKFEIVSSNALVFTVPPWAKFVSTNDALLVSNKQDVVVITTTGVALQTNAIAFDITVPNDSSHPYPMTPDEEKISKMLDAVLYSARVLGTNPVLETGIKFSASAGPQKDLRHDASVVVPGVSASIHVGTNVVPPVEQTTNAPAKP